MSAKSTVFPVIHKELVSFHGGGGLFICDPQRLDEFMGRAARYRDLTDFFDGSNGDGLFTEGIAAALSVCCATEYIGVVRDNNSPSYVKETPRLVSEGWILGTTTGSLMLCSFDSLLFWSPPTEDDELVDEDDDLIRYFPFSVPSGWYRVVILAGEHKELKDDADYERSTIEFVLTSTPERPVFSDISYKHNPASDIDNTPIRITPSEPQKPEALGPSIDRDLLRSILSRFTRHSFESFIKELFNDERQSCELLEPLTDAGEGVYCQPILDSYGESLHKAYVLQHLPLGLFKHPRLDKLADDPVLVPRLEKIRDIYKDACGQWGMVSPHITPAVKLQSLGFLLNLSGIQREQYANEIFPQYTQVLEKLGLHTPSMLVGSYDSFLDLNASGVDKALKSFFISNSECLSIQLSPGYQRVSRFTTENSFLSGVLRSNQCAYEPVVENVLKAHEQVLAEFESLLQKDVKEAELEKFLVAHYQDIFGNKYDRIEAQIWLRFPELDIAGRERRLDIFMRNSLSNDWELYEVKRVIPLISYYRGDPDFASEITHAIQQLKNYSRTLLQSSVKERLARDGIEYFEPSLHLVAGRIPQITHKQWRWLMSTHNKDVRIITYDDLMGEMRLRLSEKAQVLGMLNQKQESS